MDLKPACEALPGSPEWVETRRGAVGATDVGVILGLNPFKTPLALWAEKKGKTGDTKTNYAMRRGTGMEPFLIEEHVRETGHPVWRPGVDFPSIVQHREMPIACASLDAIVKAPTGDYILETKTTKGRWAHEGLPRHVVTQVLWQLGVTGCAEAWIAADVHGQFCEWFQPADEGWFQESVEFVSGWWNTHVVGDIPPTVTRTDTPLLPKVWAADPDHTVETPTDLVERLRMGAAQNRRYQAARHQLMELMQTATTAVDDFGQTVATWTTTKGSRRVNLDAVKALNQPDLFYLTGPTRTLRIKGDA